MAKVAPNTQPLPLARSLALRRTLASTRWRSSPEATPLKTTQIGAFIQIGRLRVLVQPNRCSYDMQGGNANSSEADSLGTSVGLSSKERWDESGAGQQARGLKSTRFVDLKAKFSVASVLALVGEAVRDPAQLSSLVFVLSLTGSVRPNDPKCLRGPLAPCSTAGSLFCGPLILTSGINFGRPDMRRPKLGRRFQRDKF